MSDRHLIKCELVTPNTPRHHGCAERGLAVLHVSQLAARKRASSRFDDVKMPNTTGYLWAQKVNYACGSSSRTANSAEPLNKKSYQTWYCGPAKPQVVLFLQHGVYNQERRKKSDPKAAASFINHGE